MLELAELTIPTGVLYALVPILAGGAVTFAAWLVRQISTLAQHNAASSANLAGVDRRLSRLESWYDGFKTGRVIGKAEHNMESDP